MYPVQTAYLAEPAPDYVKKAAEVVWNIHLQVRFYTPCPWFLTQSDTSKAVETFLFSSPAEKRLTAAWKSSLRCFPACLAMLCDSVCWRCTQGLQPMNSWLSLNPRKEGVVKSLFLPT